MKASWLGSLRNKSPFSVKNRSYFQGLKTVLIFRVKRNECCRAVYDVGCVWGLLFRVRLCLQVSVGCNNPGVYPQNEGSIA